MTLQIPTCWYPKSLADPTRSLASPTFAAGGVYFALGNFALASLWPCTFHVVCFLSPRNPTRTRFLVEYGLYDYETFQMRVTCFYNNLEQKYDIYHKAISMRDWISDALLYHASNINIHLRDLTFRKLFTKTQYHVSSNGTRYICDWLSKYGIGYCNVVGKTRAEPALSSTPNTVSLSFFI